MNAAHAKKTLRRVLWALLALVLGLVALSFLLSWLFSAIPAFAAISSGFQIIILTVVLSLGAAILFPVKEEDDAA